MTPDERCRALSAILRAQQDITVIASEPDPLLALLAVEESNAEVVLVAARDSDKTPPIVDHLLMENPSLIVIADGGVGAESCIYRFSLERRVFVDDGETSILKAIRNSRREAVH
jgi:hypothetical protein